MRGCDGCIWESKCPDADTRCEYYDNGEDEPIALDEYWNNMLEAEEIYKNLIKEQQDDAEE